LVTSSHVVRVFEVIVYTILEPLYSYAYLDTIDFSFLLAQHSLCLWSSNKYWHSFQTLFLKCLQCDTF